MYILDYIKPKQIKIELDNYIRPKAYENQSFPYNNLDNRQFEILLYYLFKEKIRRGEYKEKFDNVHLMQGIGERGRDCLLSWKGLNVGLIQCKKYKTRLTRNIVGEEIIKFILFYLEDTSLISDLSNFTYYFAVSNDFNENAINLFNELNRNEFKESEIKEWAKKNIKLYKTLQDLKIEEIIEKIYETLKNIKLLRIISADLDKWLNFCPNIISIFFSVKKVVLIDDLKTNLMQILNIPQSELKTELKKDDFTFEEILFSSPSPSFFIGRDFELNQLRDAFKVNNTIIINGIAGIGKTYLISQFIKSFYDNSPVFWLDLNNKSNLENILVNIALFFKNKFEDPELIHIIQSSSQSQNRIQIAVNLIERYKSIFIIDNFNYKKNGNIIPLLHKCNENITKGKVVIISRKAIEDQNFLNIPFQITLNGLEENKSITLMKYYLNQFNLYEPTEEILIEIHKILEGHPYFMRMIIFLSQWISLEKILENVFEYGVDIGNYIHDEIWKILNEDEKKMLNNLSVFRIPFNYSALSFFTNIGNVKRIFVSLLKKFIITPLEKSKQYYTIHNLIRFYILSKINPSDLKLSHKFAILYYKNHSEKRIIENYEQIYHSLEAGLFKDSKEEIKYFLKGLYVIGFFDFLLESSEQFLLYKEMEFVDAIHYFRGRTFRIIEDLENALNSYHKALVCTEDMFKNNEIKYEIASTLLEKSIDNIDMAISYYEELTNCEDDKIRIKSLNSIAYINLLYRDLEDEKKKYYFKIIEKSIEESIKNNFNRLTSESFQLLGIIHNKNKNYKESIKYLKNALKYQEYFEDQISDISGDIMKRYFLYDNLSSTFKELGNLSEALKYSEKCLIIDQELNLEERIAKSLYFKGYLLCQMGQYQKARQALEESLSLAIKLNLDSNKINITNYWLILAYWNLEKFKFSIEKLLELRELGGDFPIPILSGFEKEKANLSMYRRIDVLSFIAKNGHFYGLILPEHVNLDTIKKWLHEIIEKRPELIDQVKAFIFQKFTNNK